MIRAAARSFHRSPVPSAAQCSNSASCTADQTTSFARKLITYARKLASGLSQSDVFFGSSSLADDIAAGGSSSSVQSYNPDEGTNTYSGDSSIIGGLRSPQPPSLQDEGSGMIWNGKGVAPIIK